MKPKECTGGCSLTFSRAPLAEAADFGTPEAPIRVPADRVQICCGTCGGNVGGKIPAAMTEAELKADWPPQDPKNAGFRLEAQASGRREPAVRDGHGTLPVPGEEDLEEEDDDEDTVLSGDLLPFRPAEAATDVRA